MLRGALNTIAADEAPAQSRRALVTGVVGLGPKQSSMLLRNVGRGQGLAILDHHVQYFMQLLGICQLGAPIATIKAYERIESFFVTYADYRRVRTDALDLAIWIVMRTATRRIAREHRNAGLGGARFDGFGGNGGGRRTETVSVIH